MLAYANTAQQLHDLTQSWRSGAQRIALVPTMGNLHAGHLSLCQAARQIADRVVTTIFVNPTQFAENEDFDSYPRTPEEDDDILRDSGLVDSVFVPAAAEIYPHGLADAARVELPALADELCGSSRPGHFNGVAGVVLRLLNVTRPDVLVLGEKDYQQLILMRWLVRDLGLRIAVEGMPTCRAEDGLALSSRNRYLSAEERQRAPVLFRELTGIAAAIRAGERDFDKLRQPAIAALADHGFDVDYIEVRDAADLSRAHRDAETELVVLGAARLGPARLIDNVRV